MSKKDFNIEEIELEDDNRADSSELLTGEIIQGLPAGSPIEPNAELEKNEYIQFPDGVTQKVVGESHEKGGVKMSIPDGTKIVSDHLTLTSAQAKQLKKDFELNVEAGMTYAKAIDKFTKSIGLEKLNQEQEELFDSLEKDMRETQDKATAMVNREYLAKKIKAIEDKKSGLEKQRAEFFNLVFDMQESTKAPEDRADDSFKKGGTSMLDFKAVCEKYGISDAQGMQILQLGGYVTPMYEEAGVHGDDPGKGGIFVNQDQMLPTGANLSDVQKTNLMEYYKKYNPELAKSLNDGTIGWDKVILNRSLVNEVTQPGFLEKVKVNSQPTDRNTQYLKNAKTFGDLSQERVQGFVLKDYFENNPEINPTGKKFEEITPEEIYKLQEDYSNALSKAKGINYLSGVKEQETADKMFGNRTSSYLRGMVKIPGKKEGVIDVDRLYALKPEELDKQLEEYGITHKDLEQYKNAAYKYVQISPDPEVVEKDIPAKEKDKVKTKIAEGTDITDKVIPPNPAPNVPRLFYTPDQSSIPPSPMEAQLMGDIRLERIDPVRIGIETQIQEGANQRNFVANQVANLPESQRAAVLANLLANTQGMINKAATTANVTNAQNQAQAELFNIQQSGQEAVYGLNNRLNYEARQLTGKAKSEEALMNWYERNQAVNINNFQNQQKLNLMDGLYPDASLDFYGASINYDPQNPFMLQDRSKQIEFAQMMQGYLNSGSVT